MFTVYGKWIIIRVKEVAILKITLRAARVNKNLTQGQAAKKAHVNVMTIVRWEKGLTRPTYADLQLLSKIYEWPADCFLLQTESA